MRVGRARCKEQIYYTPLSQRTYRCGNCCHRVGDTLTIGFGPWLDQGNEWVNQVRPFGTTAAHGMLLFDCVIGYISEDGKECLVRWPPVLPGKQEQAGDVDAAMSGQGKIVLACDCSLKDLAEDCGSAANSSHETTTTGTPTQSFRWMVYKGSP